MDRCLPLWFFESWKVFSQNGSPLMCGCFFFSEPTVRTRYPVRLDRFKHLFSAKVSSVRSEWLEAWTWAVWCSLPADSFNHWTAPLACSHFTSFPTERCSALKSPISGLIMYLLTPHITVSHAQPLIHWDRHFQKKWLCIRMYFYVYAVSFVCVQGLFLLLPLMCDRPSEELTVHCDIYITNYEKWLRMKGLI